MRPTDEDILNSDKITTIMASEYLGMDVATLRLDMQENKLPIGTATKRKHWSYKIIARRLVAYNNGTLLESEMDDLKTKMSDMLGQMSKLQEEILSSKGNSTLIKERT